MDGEIGHEGAESPDSGAYLPHESRGNLALIRQRHRHREIAIQADGEQGENGDSAQGHVSGDVHIAELGPQGPDGIYGRQCAEGEHEESQERVSRRQIQDKVICWVMKSVVRHNSDHYE